MVLDTSALLAIYFNEPLAGWVLDQIDKQREQLRMSIVNMTECLILIRDRNRTGYAELSERLLAEPIAFVPPTVGQAQIAAAARLRYPLNLGDCFAYALAKEEDDILLAVDTDFRRTDARKVLPPATLRARKR